MRLYVLVTSYVYPGFLLLGNLLLFGNLLPLHTSTNGHQYCYTPVPSHTSTIGHQYRHTPVPSHTSTIGHQYHWTPVPLDTSTIGHQYHWTPVPLDTSTVTHPYHYTSVPSQGTEGASAITTLLYMHIFKQNQFISCKQQKLTQTAALRGSSTTNRLSGNRSSWEVHL